MLSLLKIRNLALVDELLWELGSGLIGVTGETGAGKSVIVGALKLVLGERADKSLIRSGEDSCTVEAVFEVSPSSALQTTLEDGGLTWSAEDPLIVRRIITSNSSRQFVNDSPVTLALLKKIGNELVDLHGPHDHQSLFSTDRQLSMVDAYAQSADKLQRYHIAYRQWRDLAKELHELEHAESASEHELELLRHLVTEIDSAQLQPGDEQELEDRWRRSTNASRLMEACGAALNRISGEDGLNSRLSDLQRALRDMQRIDPATESWSESVATALSGLEDLESTISHYLDDLDTDPEEALRLEDRMNLVEALKRKYGPTLADIASRRDSAAARLDALENRDSKAEKLRLELSSTRSALEQAASTLGNTRRKSAPRLAREISSQLKDLGFRQSSFEIQFHSSDEPLPHGMESVEFIFGPNPGEPMLPLRQIASSGEISRVMLAIKSALADQDDTPLMVFDEIDANVGGEIASAVGRKMATLGHRHQVVAITHFPQVAAKADHHFVVEKQVTGGRTRSRLYPVRGEERISELVRMLGGGGEKARSMAASLLEG